MKLLKSTHSQSIRAPDVQVFGAGPGGVWNRGDGLCQQLVRGRLSSQTYEGSSARPVNNYMLLAVL